MQLISRMCRWLVSGTAVALASACAGSQTGADIPTGIAIPSAHGLPAVNVRYVTLDYQNESGQPLPTFLTGIRGDNVTGMYETGKGRQRGFIYHPSTQQFAALDYPGAYDTTPYGPSFGTDGSVRAVGSYTVGNKAFAHGFFYDSALPKGQHFVKIDYPDATDTIPHSTYRSFIVGNWDKLKNGSSRREDYPTAGRGFIYDLRTERYRPFSIPGSKTTTCYGIIDGAIAGGYTKPQGIHVTHAYVYDTSRGMLYQYDHPGAVLTHFEGIAIDGKRGSYSLTGDWLALDGSLHAFYIAMKDWTYQHPIDIAYGNMQTSGNSVYSQGGATQVIGVYSTGGGVAGTNGYFAYLH